jgi:hypothetical protein
MSYNTVFSQLLKLIPIHEFVTIAMAQLAGRNSLRDIVENMPAKVVL